MNTRSYLITSSVIFLAVALVHLYRIVQGWTVMIGGWYAPNWVSVVAIIVAGLLSIQGFRLARQGRWLSWLR